MADGAIRSLSDILEQAGTALHSFDLLSESVIPKPSSIRKHLIIMVVGRVGIRIHGESPRFIMVQSG